jgi:heme/copper-type cytochrome/quinol oxidase subunit 2
MQKNRWILIAAVAVVLVLGAFWLMRRGGEPPTAVDLIEHNKALEGEWTTVSKLS